MLEQSICVERHAEALRVKAEFGKEAISGQADGCTRGRSSDGWLSPGSVLFGIAVTIMSPAAHADVEISSAATSNMDCSNGICAPTAKHAVLNAGDLENMLASGNVELTTTGSGVQADNIVVDTALSWPDSSALTLDAYQTV
jgi:hypothetical protein